VSKYTEFKEFLNKNLAAIILTAVALIPTTAAISSWFANKIIEIRDERIALLEIRLTENNMEINRHQTQIDDLKAVTGLQQQDIDTLKHC